jgi:hypothetical protein
VNNIFGDEDVFDDYFSLKGNYGYRIKKINMACRKDNKYFAGL